jgi:hypothetical protein
MTFERKLSAGRS